MLLLGEHTIPPCAACQEGWPVTCPICNEGLVHCEAGDEYYGLYFQCDNYECLSTSPVFPERRPPGGPGVP